MNADVPTLVETWELLVYTCLEPSWCIRSGNPPTAGPLKAHLPSSACCSHGGREADPVFLFPLRDLKTGPWLERTGSLHLQDWHPGEVALSLRSQGHRVASPTLPVSGDGDSSSAVWTSSVSITRMC